MTWVWLDEARVSERGGTHAQHVSHERAAPGTELDDSKGFRTRRGPPRDQPEGEDLREVEVRETEGEREGTSPKTWLISGLVTKSPREPKTGCVGFM